MTLKTNAVRVILMTILDLLKRFAEDALMIRAFFISLVLLFGTAAQFLFCKMFEHLN